ncbi:MULTISPECIES: acyltransferase family protein [Bacillus cereus group]|uniref:Acyltransferase 3 domain-containing protein n=1 Tax=Bacillus thuringiensis TaxID=1428 RepID=A0A1C4FH51_BACTU|nr:MULTISPECIES: acyltransferase [Bacillus cereus group]MED3026139.1 acyltransferase [Bacillus wiedmannii]SCC55182.1 Uncharacterized protein BTT61001_04325 [Bacillus thuringiensis]
MRKKLNLIQLSRALVPFMVILFHTSLVMNDYFNYNLLNLSFIPVSGGVYYFYILSGFMIYYIHHKDLGSIHKFKKYILNRFIRIYPLYWCITFAILPIYFLIPSFGEGHEKELDSIITSLLLLPNEKGPILAVAWSLVNTVKFYIIFSLFIILDNKWMKIICSIWTLSLIPSFFNLYEINNYILNYFFSGDNILFILGMLCAHIIIHREISIRVSIFLATCGFIGFPIAWVNSIYTIINIDFLFIISLSSVFLVLGLASIDMKKDIAISRLGNFLGQASLSIYLTHLLSLSILCKIITKLTLYGVFGGLLTSCLLVLASTVTGCFVHRFIETPLVNQLKLIIFNRKQSNKQITSNVAKTG